MKGSFTLLSEAISIYLSRVKLFTIVALLPYVVMIPLAVFLIWSISIALSLSDVQFNILSIFLIVAGVAIFTLAAVLAQSWGQTTMLYAALHSQGNPSIVYCFKKGWKIVFAHWWVSFLTTCITIGGFFLFFVPGLLFIVWFSFVDFVFVGEKKKGMAALLQSKAHVHGYFWYVTKRYFFIIVFTSLILLVPLSLIPSNMVLLAIIIVCFLLLFVTPVSTIYMSLVYKNIQTVKSESNQSSKETRSLLLFVGLLGFLVIPLLIIAIVVQIFTKAFMETTFSKNSKNFPRRVFASNQTIVEAIDADRMQDRILIRDGLRKYYQQNLSYPEVLHQLFPVYLSELPVDPVTMHTYEYKPTDNEADYMLCMYFETRSECVTARSTIP